MCGIVGIISKTATHIAALGQDILHRQVNRGPDATREYSFVDVSTQTNIYLGHNRLSIVDLSEKASQPMLDESQNYSIIFNGELYNYLEIKQELRALGWQFFSDSDTEVLLKAFIEWGTEAIHKFNGMFAFCIIDKLKREAFIYRDRFGIKPLYYACSDKEIFFASTQSGLAHALNLAPNLAFCLQGLSTGIYENSSTQSAYENLQALAPGHYLQVKFTDAACLNIAVIRYYNLSARVAEQSERLAALDFEQSKDLLKETLAHSVAIRLRADVPIALSISSGLDSNILAYLANQLNATQLNCFIYGDPQDKRSEAYTLAQNNINQHHIHYVLPQSNDSFKSLLHTTGLQGAPFASSSILAQQQIFRTIHQTGVKVVLGGQGADEVFCGYKKYFLFDLLESVRTKKDRLRSGANFAEFMLANTLRGDLNFAGLKKYLFKPKLENVYPFIPMATPLSMGLMDDFRTRNIADVTDLSLPTLLRYEDRNSMGNRIESRLPFMDFNVVELGLGLNRAMKLKRGFSKYILRESFKNNLAKPISHNRVKRGFDDVYLSDIIKAGLGQRIREFLNDHGALIKPVVAKDFNVATFFQDQNFIQHHKTFAIATSLLWYILAVNDDALLVG